MNNVPKEDIVYGACMLWLHYIHIHRVLIASSVSWSLEILYLERFAEVSQDSTLIMLL